MSKTENSDVSPAKVMEQILELDRLIDELQTQRKDLLQLWAEAVCPYKIGDTVTISGYAFRGKLGIVTKISAVAHGWKKTEYEWKVDAAVLKSDGTPGKNVVSFEKHLEQDRLLRGR